MVRLDTPRKRKALTALKQVFQRQHPAKATSIGPGMAQAVTHHQCQEKGFYR